MSAKHQQQGDVIFLFNSGEDITSITAHRSVLSIGSDVFKAMFYDKSKNEGEFNVKGVSKMVFREFLKFFYQNEQVELSMENAFDLLNLGQKYNVLKCIDDCTQYIIGILDVENVCSILKLAISYNHTKLIKECEIFIIVNSEAVLKSADFLQCDKEVLAHILKLDMLSLPEFNVFKACMAWVKVKSKQNMLTRKLVDLYLGDLFYEIRFRSMKYREFYSLITKYRFVLAKDFVTITEMFRQSKFPAGKFNPLPRHFGWNEHALIKCNRVSDSGFERNFDFDETEETSFLTNKPLILGRFTCCEISSPYVKVNVKITEIRLCSGSKAKVLLEMSATLKSKGTIELRRPILIRPGFFYTISVEKGSIAQVFYSNELKTNMVLETDISIEFHNYSSCKETEKIIGLISALDFNRI